MLQFAHGINPFVHPLSVSGRILLTNGTGDGYVKTDSQIEVAYTDGHRHCEQHVRQNQRDHLLNRTGVLVNSSNAKWKGGCCLNFLPIEEALTEPRQISAIG